MGNLCRSSAKEAADAETTSRSAAPLAHRAQEGSAYYAPADEDLDDSEYEAFREDTADYSADEDVDGLSDGDVFEVGRAPTLSNTALHGVVEANLPFFARELRSLKVCGLQAAASASSISDPLHVLTPPPKAAAWRPDGAAFAIVDVARGVVVVDSVGDAETVQTVLEGSATNTHMLQWSPHGTALVEQCPPKGEEGETNVRVWRRVEDTSSYVNEVSFTNPRREKGSSILQWTPDEKFCCHLLPDGSLQLLTGGDLAEPAAMSLPLPLPVQAFQFSPICEPYRLSVFMADTRDALQRVTAPAKVKVFDVCSSPVSAKETTTVTVKFGQHADLQWSPSGTAVLAHCQTEVDDSGQSYYGDSKLLLISYDGRSVVDLTEITDQAMGGGGSTIQAVSWSPSRDEFILVQGFQPAKATCWSWNSATNKCSQDVVLLPKAHRNTIRWNSFGSVVCVAGFGNLAGEVDFFVRSGGRGLAKVASCEASCTVSAEWAPDGRHLMTAVLAPRMRVDNGLSVWHALSGRKVVELPSEELHEVQWKPEPPGSSRFEDIAPEDIEHALTCASAKTAESSAGKKQAYRPPSARTAGAGSQVSQMMKGDLLEEKRAPPPKADGPRDEGDADSGQKELFDLQNPKKKKETTGRQHNSHGAKQPCPETGWQYLDAKGNIQGPFTLEKMQKWCTMNVFKPTLKVRCHPDDRFIPLSELFPHPMIPFHSCPKRPV